MANKNLTNAKRAKNDEFYTQYRDIQKEIEAYLEYDKDTFRDKVVYCNCDDPLESNFFGYFALNFKKLGLKRLITTSYKPSPIANTLFDITPFETDTTQKSRPKDSANRFIIDDVGEINHDGEFNLKDVAAQLKANKNNEWAPLKGDDKYSPGDFRSEECINLLKLSDIIVTNPPFSLFREYVKQLFDYNKKFVIIGNLSAIIYKEIFPLIKVNKMWLGNGFNAGNAYFSTPVNREYAGGVYDPKTGLVKFRNCCWFTNIDHGRRHQILPLMNMNENLKYSKHKEINGKKSYVKYDNYDAIEVPYTDAIPSDYNGVMGVPVSFLDKYNPDQFELLGSNRGIDQDSNRIYGRGSYVNGKETFKRVFIRHKKK